jgi:LysR family positive regulator for ilvC
MVVPRPGLVREAAQRWWRTRSRNAVITAEPDSHEALLTLVTLGSNRRTGPRAAGSGSTPRSATVATLTRTQVAAR